MTKRCDAGPWNRRCGGKAVALYTVHFVHPDGRGNETTTWRDIPRCARHDNSWQFKHVHPTKIERVGLAVSKPA